MKARWWMLGVILLVLALVIILAASLDELELQPAVPLAISSKSTGAFSLPEFHLIQETPLWQILVLWLALVFNLALFLLMLNPELRKRILRQLLRFALGVLLFLLLLRYRTVQWPEVPLAPAEQEGTQLPALPAPPEAPVFHAPVLAPWVTFAVTLILLWLISIGLYLAYRTWRIRRDRRITPLFEIADIARASLAQLSAGRDWGDVVTDAYARMSEAVRLSRGLERESYTTPREFAARLVHTGLPAASVEELTRLFETVRYGGRPSDTRAGSRAVACLETILGACKVLA